MAANIDSVVDASIILAWLLPDEREVRVNRLFAAYRQKKNHIYAPKLLVYELINGLKSAILRKRIDWLKAKRAIDVFLQMKFELIDQSGEEKTILQMANKLNLSVYDASYVVLAKKLKVKLLSLDKKLQRL
ncbi:MAG: type II toxin-antitoxin system VapC family toxin [Patescibacteria group bacterium]|nr:type II toxin-antitoxin system VapC family toxin [Patescibacteria group bacterium]